MQYFISPIVSPLSPIVSPLSPTGAHTHHSYQYRAEIIIHDDDDDDNDCFLAESVILTRAMLGDNGEKPSPCPVRVDLRGHDDEDFFTKSYRANFTC